jgi:hypothetical protein
MGSAVIGAVSFDVGISEGLADCHWDRFLQSTPLGQYHQGTAWASLKSIDGWKATRTILTREGRIIGGFQALTRKSSRGIIGYVSKGPVLLPEYSALTAYTVQLLREFADREKLQALVVQPPDLGDSELSVLDKDFLPFLRKVQDATWLIDVSGDYEKVRKGFNKTTRSHLRKAGEYGFTAREAGRDELDTFFHLMRGTCERHGVIPNPPSVDHLYAIWDASHSESCVRLFFVEHEGKPIAGELCLGFGKTLTLWKTGWNGEEKSHHPAEFGVTYALNQACAAGQYSVCDFSSFDSNVAAKILSGEHWEQSQLNGRHVFHMRFGGYPRVLPKAGVYIPNRLLRLAYRTLLPFKSLQKRLKQGRILD